MYLFSIVGILTTLVFLTCKLSPICYCRFASTCSAIAVELLLCNIVTKLRTEFHTLLQYFTYSNCHAPEMKMVNFVSSMSSVDCIFR